MKQKRIGIKIRSTAHYIKLFNGVFNLTDTEIKILGAFIDEYKKIEEAGLDLNMFSTALKKKVAKRLGRDDFNTLNNYIKNLHDKGVLTKIVDGYEVVSTLIPNGEDEVVFKLK